MRFGGCSLPVIRPGRGKRHSLANVRTIQKEFPLKLRNVYAFFTIYANIDGFDPAKHAGRPVAERQTLDRWVLSELNLAARAVREHMDEFRAYEAAQVLNDFVDGLSNWYLRRSRARYWAPGFDEDKEDAYATLYACMTTVIGLAAPFTPFLCEEIHQNVARRGLGDAAPESVHLCDVPEADAAAIDAALSEEMAAVRNIVSLGLRVRTEHKLKVRQPLYKAEVVLSDGALQQRLEQYCGLMAEELNVHEVVFTPAEESHVEYVLKPNFRALGPRLGKKMKAAKKAFQDADASSLRAALLDGGEASIEIDGETVALQPEDVEVAVQATGGFAAAGDSAAVVVLNTEIDQKLLDEGLFREILRRVQDLRKDLDVGYTERIRLRVAGSERVERVAEANREALARETLCSDLQVGGDELEACESREVEVDGEALTLDLGRG